ncbi:MAG: NAD(+)/NADH kinase [Planctomycetota bacterium]
MKRRVVLVVNRRKSLAEQLEPRVRAAIELHGELVDVLPVDSISGSLPVADAAVVIGGDGTLLNASRACMEHGTPVIGVNAGKLGFMALYDVETFEADAGRLLDVGVGLDVLEVPTLVASVLGPDGDTEDGDVRWRSEAINEFVVTAGPPYRMISLRLRFDGVDGPTVNGDGLIVATPLGSTAYNVSAGGPIAAPGAAGMLVTPIAAHSLAFRPLVLGASTEVEVELLRGNEDGPGHGTELVGDGQISVPVSSGDRVRLSASGRPVRFVRNARGSYWRTLMEKMGWAAEPGSR